MKRRTTKCPACGAGLSAKYRDQPHVSRRKIHRYQRRDYQLCRATPDSIPWWVA